MNQKQRLENFKANADQVENEATMRLHKEAVSLLKKGYSPKYVATRTFTPYRVVLELKDKIIK